MIPRKPLLMRPERWRQVEQLYHAASEREPGERAAFLQEACQSDDERKSEVESLLTQQVSSEGLLGWNVAPDLSADLVPSLNPGDELGPYRIVGAIGSGGMGEVYRALDTQLERDVAIKVLPRALANDPERLARFEREAKVLAALNHPNIAAIYGLAEARGQRALVMELVPGETLTDVIKKRKAMPFEAAAAIVRQIAEALEAAHEKGIVHRDLKPSNIMIEDNGRAVVMDFGIARTGATTLANIRSGGSLRDSLTLLTQVGDIVGTPIYMSPEQARRAEVDARSDLFALGLIFYEMLTSNVPFLGETLEDTLRKRSEETAISPSIVDPRIPKAVSQIVLKCLKTDPENRYQNAGG